MLLVPFTRTVVDNTPIHNHVDRTTKFHFSLLALSPTIDNKKPSFRRCRLHRCHRTTCYLALIEGSTINMGTSDGLAATGIDALVRRARRNAIRLGVLLPCSYHCCSSNKPKTTATSRTRFVTVCTILPLQQLLICGNCGTWP